MNQLDLKKKLNKEFKQKVFILILEDYSYHLFFDENKEQQKEIFYYNQKIKGTKELCINRDYSRERLSYLPARPKLNYRKSNRFN